MFRFSDYFFSRKTEYESTSILFRDCVLKKHIGDFQIGTKFDTIQFVPMKMTLSFFDDHGRCIMERGFNLDDVQMDT